MPIARSLRTRVLVWVGLALTVLLLTTVIGLDLAFRQTTERLRAELLESQLLGLIALAEPAPGRRLALPDAAINPRFSVADSGLYALVTDAAGTVLWQSGSLLGRTPTLPAAPAEGEQRFAALTLSDGQALEALQFGVNWEFADGATAAFTFVTAVALAPYISQQASFRRNVISWFATVIAVLLAVIIGVLGWVLRPVGRLARQVREVESGARSSLSGELPSELEGLARNLNALIETERRRLARYRHTLDDLAHSLKTPLAALRALLGQAGQPDPAALEHELARIDNLVSYQLRRARASGATGLGSAPVSIAPVLADLCDTLDKVYLHKQMRTELLVPPTARFMGDAGDLSEMLGNLLENAYKYGREAIQVTVETRSDGIRILVEDDGPGIAPADFERLLGRGTRADESVPGQGIGLAVVRETAALYSGHLALSGSALGGAGICLHLGRAGAMTTAN